jgi:two-component system chemotaxis response regulator CheY
MKRCLFVDNSAVVRKVAKRILGGHDLQIVEASSGFEAIAICATSMPEIIVVDSALSDMTAIEFIQRVRGIGTAAVKPQIAICLTEFDIGAIMRAKRAGAQGYLLKPFNRLQLLDRLQHLESAA